MNKQIKLMMQQAQKMQSSMQQLQEELDNDRIEGQAGSGLVKATVTGKSELVNLCISPEVVDPEDIEILEDMIIAAVRDAAEKSKEHAREKMQDIGIPDIGGII